MTMTILWTYLSMEEEELSDN